MLGFTVQDNLIMTKDSIVAVFRVEPIDVVLLPEQAQKEFESKIYRTLNSLDSLNNWHIQLIMRTRKAEPADFRRHFRSLNTQQLHFSNKETKNVTTDLIQDYITSLSTLLEDNIIPVKEYYLIMRIQVNTSKPKQVQEAIKKLNEDISRVTGNLYGARIECNQVVNTYPEKDGEEQIETKALDQMIKSFLRL
jgi:hypothetical protein